MPDDKYVSESGGMQQVLRVPQPVSVAEMRAAIKRKKVRDIVRAIAEQEK